MLINRINQWCAQRFFKPICPAWIRPAWIRPAWICPVTNRNIPIEAEVVNRVEESPTIFTLSLRLAEGQEQDYGDFLPGQFNMLYLFGVGEIPVSVNIDAE